MDRAIVLPSPVLTWRRTSAVVMGAALVALAAQIAVPLPGTPVPLTLQPLAVLIVGGLLGPWLGASSLLFYLALGAAGLPVFTPIGLPGVARLIGPTGGYLLAYPLAAYAVGTLSSGRAGGARGSGADLSGRPGAAVGVRREHPCCGPLWHPAVPGRRPDQAWSRRA